MSEAPLDRSERTERTEGEAGGNRRTRSILGRVAGRVTAACRSVGRYLRSGLGAVVGSPGDPAEPTGGVSDREATGESDAQAQYALVSDNASAGSDRNAVLAPDETDDAGVSRAGGDAGGDTSETLPATNGAAAAGPDRDRPELEAEWDGDELTLFSPDDADARITSDVWEDVER